MPDLELRFLTEIFSLAAFFTAMFTATAGTGGGVMLMSVMAGHLAPHILIPVHGVVQFSSCGSRAILTRKHIIKGYLKQYFVGALAGLLLGLAFSPSLDEKIFLPTLAGFILIITWVPVGLIASRIPGRFFSAGVLQTYLSLLVGATGPVSSAVLIQEDINHQRFVSTNAALMSCMHFLKICFFVWYGFSLVDHGGLLVSMAVATVLGSWCGSKITPLIPSRYSKPMVKAIISVLAVRLLFKSIVG